MDNLVELEKNLFPPESMSLRLHIVGDPSSAGSQALAQLFSSCPRVQLAPPPSAADVSRWVDNRLSTEDQADATAFLRALQATPVQDYALIIKDTSVTSHSPADICALLGEIVDEATGQKTAPWDVTYLARWMDRCDQYEQVQRMRPGQPARVMMQVRTHSPHGFQAVIVSPRGRRKMLSEDPIAVTDDGPERFLPVAAPLGIHLNHFIVHGGLIAEAVTPDPFSFNIMTDPSAAYRRQECAPIPGTALENKRTGAEVKDITTRAEQGAAKVRTAVAKREVQAVDHSGVWLLVGLGVLVVVLVALAKRR